VKMTRKIGITYNSSIDVFNGINKTAIVLGELFTKLGHELYFIDISSNITWWHDYPLHINIIITSMDKISGLDLLIDIDGLVSPQYRTQIATKSVVFMRSFLQFSEMDNSVYPELPYSSRDYNVCEIWCWDILNPVETLPSIQTLFRCPIKTVPFIWSFNVADNYLNDATNVLTNTFNIYIDEKCTNTSSPIIPLVALRELSIPNARYIFHMNRIKDNKFLKENVLDNIEIEKYSVSFEERQPYHKWKNPILFSHSRFVPIRISLLDAIWLGIPLIHNSPILKSLPVLDKLFYFGNKISEISVAFKNFTENTSLFYDELDEIKNAIRQKWGVDSHLEEWKMVLEALSPLSPLTP